MNAFKSISLCQCEGDYEDMFWFTVLNFKILFDLLPLKICLQLAIIMLLLGILD